MDPVGAAASIVALISTTRTIVLYFNKLYKAFDNAPKELIEIAELVTMVHNLLEVIHAHDQLADAPPQISEMLEATLRTVSSSLAKIERICKSAKQGSDLMSRMGWALQKKEEVASIVQRLSQAKVDLLIVFSLVSRHTSQRQLTSLQSIDEVQQEILRRIGRNISWPPDNENDGQACSHLDEIELHEDKSTTDLGDHQLISRSTQRFKAPKSHGVLISTRESLSILGSDRKSKPSCTLSSFWDQYKTVYVLSVYLRLPRFCGPRALVIDLAIRRSALYMSSLKLLHGTLSISNMVTCQSEIWRACTEGEEGVVRDLINARKASPYDSFGSCTCSRYCYVKCGDTILVAAIKSENYGLVRYLIDIGADVNALNVNQESPLHCAFLYGNLEAARLLVKCGASLDHMDAHGSTVLHVLSINNLIWSNGVTSWQYEIGIPFFDFLIANLFDDFDVANRAELTPLIVFAWCGCTELFIKLLRCGARAKISTALPFCGNLLQAAARGNNVTIMKLVLQENPDANLHMVGFRRENLLHEAFQSICQRPTRAMVEFLVCGGVDVNFRDELGRNALMYCVSRPVLYSYPAIQSIVDFLIESGADLRTKDCIGNTLLHLASLYRKIDFMVRFIADGHNTNATNMFGITPLHYAVRAPEVFYDLRLEKLADVFDLLFASGADPSITGCFMYCNDANFKCPPYAEMMMDYQPSRAFLTTAGLTSLCSSEDRDKILAIFHNSLHKFYPEVSIDIDGDVFWNAKENLGIPGYGSEYLVVEAQDAEMDQEKLLRCIWRGAGYIFYRPSDLLT